jgi:erythromycin esterase-like protein
MSDRAPRFGTLDDWIAREAISFSVDSPATFNAAVDKMIAALNGSIELLGFGEALHALPGGDEILRLRNRLFERLAEVHGYSAIAIESSFPRAPLVNEFVAGRGPDAYETIAETGFSHNFGRADANRELVLWMKRYNADPSHRVKLQFYGFDSPTEMMYCDSPRRLLHFALDFLASTGGNQERRPRIDALLGPDADWENSAAAFDPSKSIGLSPAATALRIETEDLITELQIRRPELAAKSGADRYREAAQYASAARQLLSYHAGLARPSPKRTADLLGLRDAMMADNLAYIVSRERGRGRVLAFAHNSHLKYGQARWQLGSELLTWWPAGAHLQQMFGPRYAVIGSAVGLSPANGIGPPETGTLEARLMAAPGPARILPTHKGQGLHPSEIESLPIRSGSMMNPTYFPLAGQSCAEFDWLML